MFVLRGELKVKKKTFLVVAVNFVGTNTRVFCFPSSIDTLLLVHLHVLVAFEDERLVVAPTFTTVQLEHSGRTVTVHAHRMPLTIVDCDGRQPKVLLFRTQAVEVKAEAQTSIFDLEDAIFACVLIRDAEELSMFFSGTEPQLNGSDETDWLERQGVLDVALRVKRGRYSLLVTSGASPARTALATRLRQ